MFCGVVSLCRVGYVLLPHVVCSCDVYLVLCAYSGRCGRFVLRRGRSSDLRSLRCFMACSHIEAYWYPPPPPCASTLKVGKTTITRAPVLRQARACARRAVPKKHVSPLLIALILERALNVLGKGCGLGKVHGP